MAGFSTARQNMVDCQVRPSDVTDVRIIEAMLKVPRELFVPLDRRALAYLDLDLDVSEEASTRRCLIKPAVTARMLQAAAIRETDKVLVVGCATGYIAAVVGQFASEVTATESESALAAKARAVLAELGMGKVSIEVAAATDGDRAHAPYDVIVLNGATEIFPEGLCQQLREGGRLVGVFAATQPPRATIVTHSHEDFGSRPLFDAVAPALPGLERRPAFVF
ncbi:MAG TPA: protein-L-isoaspartate O-methyltransferase [Gammaproteobacteria bacterium]|nr:protein-L-isoaspartate O-methyltransferase [Gammaproteobacteria bacterium]